MAVPKKKTSPAKRGMRRSANALKQPTYVEDKDSGELRRPHHRTRASKLLGISRPTLLSKIDKYRLKVETSIKSDQT